MKVHRLYPPTESQLQQVTATKARATLRAFATFCDAHDAAVIAAAGATTETLAHVARIELWLGRYIAAVPVADGKS